MKKIGLTILTIIIPSLVYANEPMEFTTFPKADGAVNVVSSSKMSVSSEQLIKEKNEMQTKGYVEKENPEIKELLTIKRTAEYEIKNFKNIEKIRNNPNKNTMQFPQYGSVYVDTHIKASYKEIKLAFPYKEIPMQEGSTIIGYAAIGEWHDGWTGINVFFENKDLGICSYELNNMAISHGAVNISEDVARYDINKMPNTLLVEGSTKSGFLYRINFFDSQFSKSLECAKTKFDKSTTNKLIGFAKVLDNTQA